MSYLHLYLPALLCLVAIGQAMIAVINLSLVRLLRWEDELARVPLLMREVFHVHKWFISITLALFATLTWRFATELTVQPLGRWLAGGIAVFWGIRTVLQATYYSTEHWRGIPTRLAAHFTLLAVYGGFTLVYTAAALGL